MESIMISEIYPFIRNLDRNELTTLNEIVFNDIVSKKWFEPGKIFEERGNYASAKICYKMALLYDPFVLETYFKLLGIQLKDQQYEEAVKTIANLRIYHIDNWYDYVFNYFKANDYLTKFRLYIESKLQKHNSHSNGLNFYSEILGILSNF